MNGEEIGLELEHSQLELANTDELLEQREPRKGSERTMQEDLAHELDDNGFLVEMEHVVPPRDRVDIAVFPNDTYDACALIELKTADAIRGIGQLLSYSFSVPVKPHLVLVVSWPAFTSQTARACKVAGIEMWTQQDGAFAYVTGPDSLWNAYREGRGIQRLTWSPGGSRQEYFPTIR